jgi:hypothetical protein
VLSSILGGGFGGAPGPVMPSDAGEALQPAAASAASSGSNLVIVAPVVCAVLRVPAPDVVQALALAAPSAQQVAACESRAVAVRRALLAAARAPLVAAAPSARLAEAPHGRLAAELHAGSGEPEQEPRLLARDGRPAAVRSRAAAASRVPDAAAQSHWVPDGIAAQPVGPALPGARWPVAAGSGAVRRQVPRPERRARSGAALHGWASLAP